MKTKRFLSLFIALVLCFSSLNVLADGENTDEKFKEQVEVFYKTLVQYRIEQGFVY